MMTGPNKDSHTPDDGMSATTSHESQTREHAQPFVRGADIETTVTVTAKEAEQGAPLVISYTLPSTGEQCTYQTRLDAGTQQGQSFRIQGEGDFSPTGGTRGDLIVTIQVASSSVRQTGGLSTKLAIVILVALVLNAVVMLHLWESATQQRDSGGKASTDASVQETAVDTEIPDQESPNDSKTETSSISESDAASDQETSDPESEEDAATTEPDNPPVESGNELADAFADILDGADGIDYSGGWNTPGPNSDNAVRFVYALIEMSGDDDPELMVGAIDGLGDARYLIYYYDPYDKEARQILSHPLTWSGDPNSDQQVAYGRAADGHALVERRSIAESGDTYYRITTDGLSEQRESSDHLDYTGMNFHEVSERSYLEDL